MYNSQYISLKDLSKMQSKKSKTFTNYFAILGAAFAIGLSFIELTSASAAPSETKGLLNAFMGCVKGNFAYNSEYCKKHKKDLYLDNVTNFKIASYIASLSGVRIMGYYQAGVNLRLKARCSKEPTLEGIYSYSGKEIMLCTNNMVGSGRPALTLQHELVHAAQHCNRGPISSSPQLKGDFLSGPLSTNDLIIVKEIYPKEQWVDELEARRGVTSGLLIDTAVLVYRACM